MALRAAKARRRRSIAPPSAKLAAFIFTALIGKIISPLVKAAHINLSASNDLEEVVNQGKRRLNQSLRFVRAVPLNLRDCADVRRGLEQFAVDASPPLFIAVSVATCVVSDDDDAHERAIEKCLMAGMRLNFARKGHS